jgi:hypothetical protein
LIPRRNRRWDFEAEYERPRRRARRDVEGLNVGGSGINSIQTKLFTESGRLFR